MGIHDYLILTYPSSITIWLNYQRVGSLIPLSILMINTVYSLTYQSNIGLNHLDISNCMHVKRLFNHTNGFKCRCLNFSINLFHFWTFKVDWFMGNKCFHLLRGPPLLLILVKVSTRYVFFFVVAPLTSHTNMTIGFVTWRTRYAKHSWVMKNANDKFTPKFVCYKREGGGS